MSMFGYSFPRTYADLEAAPWCDSVERWIGADGVFIHVHFDWLLDAEWRVCSAHGENLKEALEDLRSEFWSDMRPPSAAMGDGACRIIKQHIREVMSMPKG